MRSILLQWAHTAQSCGFAFAPEFDADVGTAIYCPAAVPQGSVY